MVEEWRPVVGYEGIYEVSNHGNVRSLDRTRRNGTGMIPVKGRPVTQHRLRFGHLCVYLYKQPGQRHKRWLVHRLVLLAFVGPCPEGHETCHRDGVPDNNHVDNLYWGTRSENQLDSIRHGTHNTIQKARRTHCGQGHEYTPENTYYHPQRGSRVCRQCTNERHRARRAAAKELKVVA